MARARCTDYRHPMNKKSKQHFFKTNKTNRAGLALGAVLLAALAQSPVHAGIQIGIGLPVVVVAPPVVVVAPVVADDYVYYPNYDVYYNSSRHQYAYMQGGAWVSTPAPNGVSVDVLLASPSVNMDWHDSPSRHHDEMIQKYPRNWRPDAGHQDNRDDLRKSPPDSMQK